MKFLWIIVFLFLTAILAHSATYYVNQSQEPAQTPVAKGMLVNGQMRMIQPLVNTPARPAPGNDSNDGSLSAPFATIGKAASVMVSNDLALVYPGYYLEYVTNNVPFVTFQAVSGSSESVKSGGFMCRTNNVTIDGNNAWCFTGTNSPYSSLGGTIRFQEGSKNCVLKNASVFQIPSPFGTLAGAPPSIATVCATNRYFATSNIWIENITFTNQGYIAATISGSAIVMTNCYFSGTNGFDGVQMTCINSDFVNLTWSNFNNPHLNSVHCDLIQGFTDNNAWCTNNTIRNCLGMDALDDTKIGNFSDASNERMTNIWFINNIWFRVVGLRDISAPGVHSVNETFLYCGQGGAHPLSGSVVNDATHGDTRGCLTFNSLFYGCGLKVNAGNNGANGWYAYPTNGQPGTVSGFSSGGNRMDYNWGIATNGGSKRAFPSSVVGWGYTNDVGKTEAHGINGGDPQFDTSVNYSNIWLAPEMVSPSQVALKATSPGVASGTNLTGLVRGINVDFYSNPRPASGAWDIGAIQTQ